jgi:hypothetical protein
MDRRVKPGDDAMEAAPYDWKTALMEMLDGQ